MGEVLEEVHQSSTGGWADFYLSAKVHQHLVQQHQGGKTVLLGLRKQLHHKRLGRRRLPFLVLTLGMDETKALRSSQLIGQDAPRVFEHPRRAIRAGCLDALLQVHLVKAQRSYPGFGRLEANVGLEFPDGWKVGQTVRVVDQVPQGDESVGLAAAVVYGELPVCLIGPASQAQANVLHQFPQVVRGVGEGKELGRVFVDWPTALLHHHVK